MKRELCEQLITECEQVCEKMGLNFYETMKKAPAVVERWRPFYEAAQRVWQQATNREDTIKCLESMPDADPQELQKFLAIMRTIPYLLRGWLQDAAKGLPPSPGGRPQELTPEQQKEVCKQIGQLYADGVALSDAKTRMAQSYGVSLSTIQRAWQKRGLQPKIRESRV